MTFFVKFKSVMDHQFCPGAKRLRQPKPEIHKCPYCGSEVEIWSDEIRGVCPQCKKAVMRDGMVSCLDWCKYARECVGDDVYEDYMHNKTESLKYKLLSLLEEEDSRRQAEHLLAKVEQLMISSEAEPYIVIPAVLLYAVLHFERSGAGNGAENGYDSTLKEARSILLDQGLNSDDTERILTLASLPESVGEQAGSPESGGTEAVIAGAATPKSADHADGTNRRLVLEIVNYSRQK
jgi:hypothetical protein